MKMATHISQTVPVAYFSLEMSGRRWALSIIAGTVKGNRRSFIASGLLSRGVVQDTEACSKLYDKSRMKVISELGEQLRYRNEDPQVVRCDA
jgi:hypothetical protein